MWSFKMPWDTSSTDTDSWTHARGRKLGLRKRKGRFPLLIWGLYLPLWIRSSLAQSSCIHMLRSQALASTTPTWEASVQILQRCDLLLQHRLPKFQLGSETDPPPCISEFATWAHSGCCSPLLNREITFSAGNSHCTGTRPRDSNSCISCPDSVLPSASHGSGPCQSHTVWTTATVLWFLCLNLKWYGLLKAENDIFLFSL